MPGAVQNRIDDLLRTVGGDEEAFNRSAEAKRLNVYLRHGHIYPWAVGQTHTARLAAALPSVAAAYRCRSTRRLT